MNSRSPLRQGLLIAALLAFQLIPRAAAGSAAVPLALTSPDGKIVVTINAAGALNYQVSVDGVPILNESRLGLRFHDGVVLGRDVTLVKADTAEVDTTWTNPLGKRRGVRDHHRELALTLRENEPGGRIFELVLRAFDDGVGFRYGLPAGGAAADFIVDEEITQFAFTADNVCFAGDHIAVPPDAYDSRGGFAGSQEWEFRRQRLADLPVETVTGLPMLTQTPAAWVAVTEADLVDWAGMWLAREPQAAVTGAVTLRARLAPRLDGQGLVKASLPHMSPWRVLMIGREPGKLIESDLVLNLSTPCQIADPSWVKPGMMAWDQWWSGVGKMDTGTMKDFIAFAGEMGWPYQLIDGGWYSGTPGLHRADSDITKPAPSVDMDELRRFAAQSNVRLWVWLYWSDAYRDDAYKKAFELYEKWGLAGVKIDFMDRDDQEMVNWYEKITREAAEHHLMVDFHGAYKPTGMIRTWPNQITREGILGNEYNKWSRRVTPEHRVTLPFTRFLAGPGDFTPGGFINRPPEKFEKGVSPTQVQSTRAGQLALFVAYDSPVCCVCDHPINLRGQPGIDFLRQVPTVWDDTRVLSGAVAQYLVVARRSGADWYLGALNNSYVRVCSVKLDFLAAGKWKLRWWHDAADSADNAEHLETEDRIVSAGDTLDVHMAPAGGAVMHLAPMWAPSDGANHPMGVGKGVFPGRVVWTRDATATPWDGKTGNWWDEGTGISQPVVDRMMSSLVRGLVGASSDSAAWEAIFRYHNRIRRGTDAGYSPGEKIAVKINCNNAYGGYGDVDGQIDQSPQTLVAMLRQLIASAGVPQEMITVYEAVRVVPDRVYNPAHKAFPRVRFVDSMGNGANGRFPPEFQKDALHYSVPDPKVGRDLPRCVVEATYLMNMTLVKGHPTTGVSLTAKNHYGTVDVRDHEVFVNSHSHPMGSYHPFVDMIGSKELGGKTLVFVLDGLYGVRDVNDNVAEHGHWETLFHGQWLASLFMSQDPIAIDSVGLDLLHAEFPLGRFTDFQPMRNSDNYMHEAALADNPPSGTHYAPDGVPLKSLGVHEHWNNDLDRQYSRNLDPVAGKGIELLVVPANPSVGQ